ATSTMRSKPQPDNHNRVTLVALTLVFFLITPRPPIPTLFPYTTLFRSHPPATRHDRDSSRSGARHARIGDRIRTSRTGARQRCRDRKSTRLNSSHVSISYAVFCLKKKNELLVRSPVRHPGAGRRPVANL